MSGRPLPPVTPDTAAWWDGTRTRRLLLQRCGDCGAFQHYPRPLCLACGGDVALVEASGSGRVRSFTVVHRAVVDGLAPPYVVALVRLAEGPSVLSNVVGCPPGAVRCDQDVTVTWEPLADGRHLPLFTPSGPPAPPAPGAE